MTAATTEDSQKDDACSVGIVQPQSVTLFEGSHVLQLEGGGELGQVQVTYETYGELNEQRDNAIFVCHALTGDAHAAGWHSPEHKKPGWWDDLIGPGKGLDTNKYFVICANILGGCQGTTGPGSINPVTEERYCRDFPFITVRDMVDVHTEVVKHLKIEKLLAVIGGSLGGMQVLEWSARYPDQLQSAIVLASAAQLSAQGIAFNAVGNRAISQDPNFNNGDYYDTEGPKYGLALARMVAHITYLSEASIELKFGRRLQDNTELTYGLLQETEFQIESYLHYQGNQFVERFDANSYLYITRAMDYYDLTHGSKSLTEALGKTKARFLIASYDTDWLFPAAQSRELVSALIETGKHVTYREFQSPYGHDSFLIEIDQLTELVVPFLQRAQQDSQKTVAP